MVTLHTEPIESRIGSMGQPQILEIIGLRNVQILGGGPSCPFVVRSGKSGITVTRAFTHGFTSGSNTSTRSYLTTESTKGSTKIARNVVYSREMAQCIRSCCAWLISYRVGVSLGNESKYIYSHPGSVGRWVPSVRPPRLDPSITLHHRIEASVDGVPPTRVTCY